MQKISSTRLFLIITLAWLGIAHGSLYFENEQAVIVRIPVADCLGKPAEDIDPTVSPSKFYEYLAYSPEKGPNSCPRVHQCLFNEVGIVCGEKKDELLVEFPQFYCRDAKGNFTSRFWLLKSALVRAVDVNKSLLKAIPDPFDYKAPVLSNGKVLTLILPWTDQNGNFYSAGTRFVRDEQNDNDLFWGAVLIDFQAQKVRAAQIEREKAVVNKPLSAKESKQLFMQIIRLWKGDAEKSAIPYVWGGCSYIERTPPRNFKFETFVRGNEEIGNWQRPTAPGVHTGFDCSGLILRAAQAAGISYFCKNTVTIGLTLKELSSETETLEEGDLILIPRHVLIVASLKDNTVIDTSGYTSGWASLQELPLAERYNAADFATLQKLLVTKEAIKRLNYKKEESAEESMRLLRLP